MKNVKTRRFGAFLVAAFLMISTIFGDTHIVMAATNGNAGETEQEWFTNGGFESGDTTPGSVTWGNSQASVTTDNVHSGTYALQVSGEKGAWEVKIDNLTPNTEYTITVWAKAGESAAGAVGVKEFDSAVTTDNIVYQMGTEYQEYTLTFTTGSNDTRATFFVNNRSLELKGAAGTIYADDISMKYIASDPNTGGETEDPDTSGETEDPDTGGETEDPDTGEETGQEWFTNGGFESGDTTPGSVTWGNSQASVTTDNVHSGTYALQVSGEKGAWEVKIDNLTPNTEYTITVWAKAGESAAGAVGVKEFDSAVTTDNIVYQMGTEYQEYTLTFTTGSNDTRATFFVNNRSLELKGAAGTIYADDISMKYIANEQENDNKPQNPANEVLNESPEWLPMTDPDNAREWKLSVTMSDEFNAAELDTSKWENPHGAWSGRSPSWFEPTNVRMEDGNLVLRSCMVDDDYSSPTLDKLGAAYHTYAAAAVRSKQLTGYGYYEIRCKTAPISMTSSFWFRNADKIKEIDVFEQIGRPKKGSLNKNGKDYPINTHNGSGENDHTTPFTYTADVDLTADFHVYGFEWDEYFLRFYFDGKLIHEISNEDTDVYSVEQNAIFDMETFAWAGYPEKEDFYVDENGYFTGDFYVDYFRVWRSDVPQSNESSGLNAVPEPKEAVAVYGSPVVEEDSTAVDECWDDAYELGELHFKNPSDTDISAVVKTMWDENYLYVMADVSDSDLYNNPTTEANHQSDSFEVYVDLLNEKAKEGYDSNDFKVNTTFFGRYEKTSNAPEGVVHNAFVKDGGYIAQFKIPWMAVEPEADTIIGFDVQVNEATSAENGRAGYLGWNDSLDTVWKTMLTSGNLKLAAKEETEEPGNGGETEEPGNGGETEQADNGQNNTPDTQNVVAPSTGDNNHMELWLVLMVVACSLMGFSICLLKRKR